MRTSRVVFAGIAVAAAAATTSAFTASNTGMATTDVAGYGENSVTGTHVTNVAYTPVAADGTFLDYVVFTVTTDITGKTSTMTLKSGTNPIHVPYSCAPLAAWDTHQMTIKCAATDTPRVDAFDGVGLTVVQ